jgi:hypothetical protein
MVNERVRQSIVKNVLLHIFLRAKRLKILSQGRRALVSLLCFGKNSKLWYSAQ